MRRILTTLLTSGLIVALGTPATLAAAGDRDGASPAGTTGEPSIVAAKPAPIVPALSIRASVDRAVTTMLRAAPIAPTQGPTPTTRRGKTAIRAQGGGGKTGMIIGLVSTLVGVAATVYMVREMQKQQVDDEDR
jgi:fructose-specific phosphotransferase system IIC component